MHVHLQDDEYVHTSLCSLVELQRVLQLAVLVRKDSVREPPSVMDLSRVATMSSSRGTRWELNRVGIITRVCNITCTSHTAWPDNV